MTWGRVIGSGTMNELCLCLCFVSVIDIGVLYRFVTDIQERAILTTDEVMTSMIPISVKEGPVGMLFLSIILDD